MHTPAGIEAFVPESIVQERYWKIYRSYNRIRSVLASDRNEYLPIYRLHDHLLVEIWNYLGLLDRHRATMVSRRFQRVALNTAHLWTLINFGDSRTVPLINTLLKRARAAPLHIRAVDHVPWALPPGRSTYYTLSPPVPPNLLLPSSEVIASIPRAAILDAAVFRKESPGAPLQYQVEPKLNLEDLTMPMPLLRSLRLYMFPMMSNSVYNIHHSSPEPLFNDHAPLLRHVALIQSNFNWSDRVFRNLTYLLIRKPGTQFGISRLVQVLLASTSLTYLGLDSAIAPADSDTPTSSVRLPALQRLYITDLDTQRITAALRCITSPNVLEADFTSADSAWFCPTRGFSPFSHIHATQDVIITVTERDSYCWTIECRRDAKYAVRFHFDLRVTNYHVATGHGRGHESETANLIDTLHVLPILFGQVESLTLRGDFSVKNLKQVLSLFPVIKRLSTRYLNPPPNFYSEVQNHDGILDILSVERCPQLRAIDIRAWPELSSSYLITWIFARSTQEGGCSKLDTVIVTSDKPLSSEIRSQIDLLVDKFLWRKSTVPNPSNDLPRLCGNYYHYFHPSGVPLPSTQVTAPQLMEDETWDDDDEEWARVPCPPDQRSPSLNRSLLDDPNFVYCDEALQERWNYFAIPEA